LRGSAQAAKPVFRWIEAKHLEQAKTRQADEDQIDRDHKVEEARHDQNQNARDQGHDRLNVGCRDGHLKYLRNVVGEGLESTPAT
jgi:hypothetical protein